MTKGQYGCLYVKDERVGGFLYWDKQEKPPIGYWTSNWWLFKDFKEGEIELYEIVKNELKVIQKREKVKICNSHKIRLGAIMRGSVKFEVI